MLAGTRFGDVRTFAEDHGDLIVYVEAAEDPAITVARHLWRLRLAGWFDAAAAILVGATAPTELSVHHGGRRVGPWCTESREGAGQRATLDARRPT